VIAAGLLGMSRMNLNRIITGHRGISATTAMRLSRILPDTDAAYWMTRQNHYDLFAAGKGTKGR
jgi:addiction module HigA family antidote